MKLNNPIELVAIRFLGVGFEVALLHGGDLEIPDRYLEIDISLVIWRKSWIKHI